MIISFNLKFDYGKGIITNAKQDLLDFSGISDDGYIVDFNYIEKEYKIYFDTKIDIDDADILTPIINDVKQLFLRSKKIKRILHGKSNTI